MTGWQVKCNYSNRQLVSYTTCQNVAPSIHIISTHHRKYWLSYTFSLTSDGNVGRLKISYTHYRSCYQRDNKLTSNCTNELRYWMKRLMNERKNYQASRWRRTADGVWRKTKSITHFSWEIISTQSKIHRARTSIQGTTEALISLLQDHSEGAI